MSETRRDFDGKETPVGAAEQCSTPLFPSIKAPTVRTPSACHNERVTAVDLHLRQRHNQFSQTRLRRENGSPNAITTLISPQTWAYL